MQILSRPVRALTCVLAVLVCAACSDSEAPAVANAADSAPASASSVPVALLSGTTTSTTQPIPIPAPPQVPARSYYVIDYTTGAVIAAFNENERVEPASITKLMVAYAVFHALADGRITLDDLVTISRHARAQEGSRMFVEVGSKVRVEDLIQGMIVQSGNDATVALAEHVAGSEPVFVDLMNQYAQKLGLVDTHFENSPGMPSAQHYTTARDIAVLSAALIREFPQYFKWYSQREFTWNKITQPNRNGLLDRDPSIDGLKTGHTESAGYCLVATGMRDGMRIISVVMGAPSVRAREDASLALINYGFRFFETKHLIAADKPVLTARVWKGEVNEIALAPREDIYVTVPRGQDAALAGAADVAHPLLAPLERATAAGKLRITRGENLVGTYDLYPVADVPPAGVFGRLWDEVLLMFE
ncbi:MAG TPA: D-alanyl-D-alanine carboxypeptidase family protein [Steroidobacteraceae bacterium]